MNDLSTQEGLAAHADGSSAVARPRVLVADPVAQAGVDILLAGCDVTVATGLGPDELRELVATTNVLVVRSETKVTESLMLAAPSLQLIGRAGAGVDNIDVDAASRLGILVVNAPSGNTVAAAEHTLAMMLALVRNIAPADASMRAGKWDRKSLLGTELRGKTLGVLGLGRIGLEVAKMAKQGLAMDVLAYDPVVGPDSAEAAGVRLVELPELLKSADVITAHAPLTDKTKGMIGTAEIELMKPSARIINVARGGIVDEAALVAALQADKIAGAGLDVFEEEPLPAGHVLRTLPNVVITPHLGASTEEAQVNVAVDLAGQILEYLNGEMPRFAVNLPSVLPSDLARLQPFVALGGKLGSLGAQLYQGGIRRVTCSFSGDLARLETSYITSEVLRSILSAFTEDRVNSVNAKLVARDRGVAVEERTDSRGSPGPDVLVELDGATHIAIGGVVVGDESRVTSIHGFPVDVRAEGRFLVVTHSDQPGVLAAVAGMLAARDVNIGSVGLGRDRPRGQAVMVMEVDDSVPADLMNAIQHCDGVDTAAVVQL